ncbi:MAG: CRISPR-associated endonuclease Cas2 [Asgard group archaeon]|nr:CRISPR-associated endonuclease Cas2 [Asgard group archaeon]
MRYLVSYDISKDSIRTKIAKLCQKYGLARMQFSVFTGKTTRNMIETFAIEAKDTIGKKRGEKVIVIPICERCQEKVISISGGQSIQIGKEVAVLSKEKVVIV